MTNKKNTVLGTIIATTATGMLAYGLHEDPAAVPHALAFTIPGFGAGLVGGALISLGACIVNEKFASNNFIQIMTASCAAGTLLLANEGYKFGQGWNKQFEDNKKAVSNLDRAPVNLMTQTAEEIIAAHPNQKAFTLQQALAMKS